jgi:hypothetical protein
MSEHRLHPPCVTDAHLIKLRTAELFVVVSVRLWAAPYRDPTGDHPAWQSGFASAGIGGDGVVGFDTLFRIVVAAHRRTLDVRSLRCGRLGRDEVLLLQLVGLLQREMIDDALAMLSEWLPPAAIHMALLPAQRFAAGLAEAGLVIPDPRPPAAWSTAAVVMLHGDPGLGLVH